MPKVVITCEDRESETYSVEPFVSYEEVTPSYQIVMEMKASHLLNMQRNLKRVQTDQETLAKFFEYGKETGREFRER